MGLHPRLMASLKATCLDPLPRVQALAVPPALLGRDVLALASPTVDTIGAMVLPIVHRLLTRPAERLGGRQAPRALLLAPTKAFGEAIAAEAYSYGAPMGLRRRVALGEPAAHAFPLHDCDILVATPAGLLELLHRGQLVLDSVEVLALASFDRMLARECISAIGRVIHHLPAQRQVLLFHEGLPGYAQDLAAQIVRDPVRVVAAQPRGARTGVKQGVFHVANEGKLQALTMLLQQPSVVRALVFTRTRHATIAVSRFVRHAGGEAEAMHDAVSPGGRDSVLARFCDGGLRLLVTTDTALRDADVGPVSHVISYDLPSDASDYFARLSRLANGAGAGVAISFCAESERSALGRIERELGDPIPNLGEDFEPPPTPAVNGARKSSDA